MAGCKVVGGRKLSPLGVVRGPFPIGIVFFPPCHAFFFKLSGEGKLKVLSVLILPKFSGDSFPGGGGAMAWLARHGWLEIQSLVNHSGVRRTGD